MDIWAACQDLISPGFCSGKLTRVVESQEQIATNALVEGFEKQGLLEEMLEQTKPPRPPGTENLHWLLATPFRYPPLPHGSRFGTRFERSLFYGSLALPTAFAETAYYRFLFWQGMATPPPSGKLLTQHTAFQALYKTQRGLKLHKPPFDEHEDWLVHRSSYAATQQLGVQLREAGVEAVEFISARDGDRGINVALFSAQALVSTRPVNPQPWLCETTAQRVSFYADSHSDIHEFALADYLINGQFPAAVA